MLVWISLLTKLAALHPQTFKFASDIHVLPLLSASPQKNTPRTRLAVNARLDLAVHQTRRVAPAHIQVVLVERGLHGSRDLCSLARDGVAVGGVVFHVHHHVHLLVPAR